MAQTLYYRQCELRNGTARTVTWIPEKFAALRQVLRLKGEDGAWEDGWIVEAVYSRLEESQLPDSHSLIKAHRQATGDSWPKGGQR